LRQSDNNDTLCAVVPCSQQTAAKHS
jgi:hypothetical protein